MVYNPNSAPSVRIMRSISHFIASISMLVAASLLAWFVLPLIPDMSWFASPITRLSFILLLVFAWGVWHAWHNWSTRQVIRPKLTPYIENKKILLAQNFQSAYHFLFQHNMLENELVVFLSLDLSHTHVILQNRFEAVPMDAETSNICRWYVKDKQTIIAPNLAALYTEWKDEHSFYIAEFIAKLLKPYRKQLNQIYLWLDFNSLSDQYFKKTLRFYGAIFQKLFGRKKIACHLLFNILQHLDGYKYFLSNFDEGEKTLPLGLKIDSSRNSQYAREIAPGLEALIASFNPTQHTNISDFIKHLRRLKTRFIISAQSLPKNISLKGIYFTAKDIDHYLFCNYIILRKLALPASYPHKPTQPIYKYITAGTFAVLIMSSYLYVDYYQDTKQAHLIQYDLSQLNQQQFETSQKLNALNQLMIKYNYPTYASIFRKSSAQKALLQQEYNDLIQNSFLPDLNQQITQALQAQQNAQTLYHLLALYLMLTGQHPLDKAVLESSYNALNPQDTQVAKAQITTLEQVLNNKSIQLPGADQNLIQSARFVLANAMLSEIIYDQIKDEYNQSQAKVSYDGIEIMQPMYLSRNFDDIYQKKIPSLVKIFFEEDWVTKSNNVSSAQLNATDKAVKNLYLINYLNYWQNLVIKQSFSNINNLNDLANALTQITQGQKPFAAFFDAAQTNLMPLKRLAETQTATENLSRIIALMQDYLKASQSNNTLLALQQRISDIAHSRNVPQAAYQYTAARMRDGGATDEIGNLLIAAHDAPNPLKDWFYQIANQSWHLLLASSYDYVNQTWQQNVYPFYKQYVADRFPLDPDAGKTIDIEKFSEFFNSNGMVSQFFDQYLSPFVDTSSLYWNLKSLDQQALPINQSSLEMFMRSALIRKMFFAGASQTPQFSFNLIPQIVDSRIRNISFQYNRQQIGFQDNLRNNTLNWIASDSDQAILNITDNNGQNVVIRKSGPWALLELLNSADIETTNDPKIYHILFTLNQKKAQFELTCNALINPFIPDILSAFHAQDSL